jgi:hypothetical protein
MCFTRYLINLRGDALFGSCEVVEGGSHVSGGWGALRAAAR